MRSGRVTQAVGHSNPCPRVSYPPRTCVFSNHVGIRRRLVQTRVHNSWQQRCSKQTTPGPQSNWSGRKRPANSIPLPPFCNLKFEIPPEYSWHTLTTQQMARLVKTDDTRRIPSPPSNRQSLAPRMDSTPARASWLRSSAADSPRRPRL